MRRIPTSTALFSLFLLPCFTLEVQSAPAPDDVESAKSKLVALKGKLPSMLKECLGDEKVWPVKFKGRVSSMRLISPNEAKLTIRLDYVPPKTNDKPEDGGLPGVGPAGGGIQGGGAPGVRRSPNQVVFIYLKFFDGAWTTYQASPGTAAAFQNGVNHLMAAIDELAEQEAGK
jgi:hypothetical protein